jgi:hypothetical protein
MSPSAFSDVVAVIPRTRIPEPMLDDRILTTGATKSRFCFAKGARILGLVGPLGALMRSLAAAKGHPAITPHWTVRRGGSLFIVPAKSDLNNDTGETL